MKELEKAKPILMSTSMVQAICAGLKTETRRVCNPQPDKVSVNSYQTEFKWYYPKYNIGDFIYIREGFSYLKASDSIIYKAQFDYSEQKIIKWKPGIHMPKRFARIILKCTGVKLHQIQAITESECIAEGVKALKAWHSFPLDRNPRLIFTLLWNDINEKRGYGWYKNPWVWAYKFEIHEVINNGI